MEISKTESQIDFSLLFHFISLLSEVFVKTESKLLYRETWKNTAKTLLD
jgi:hypothetical protein